MSKFFIYSGCEMSAIADFFFSFSAKMKDFLEYQTLKKSTLSNVSLPLNNSKRVVLILDKSSKGYFDEVLKGGSGTERFQKTILSAIVSNECSTDSTDKELLIPENQSTPNELAHLQSTIDTLIAFQPEAVIIKVQSLSKGLERTILRTQPNIRISIGKSIPAPYGNIQIMDDNQDFCTLLAC